MLDKMLTQVEKFQRGILGYPIPEQPTTLSSKRAKARFDHLTEEATEMNCSGTIQDQADAFIDSIYVALGGLIEMGILPGPIFEAVHEANMKKVRGNVAKRDNHEGYDAVKPPGWTPADLQPFLTITKNDALHLLALKSSMKWDKMMAELEENKPKRSTGMHPALGAAYTKGDKTLLPSTKTVLQKHADATGGMKDDGTKSRWSLLLEGMPRGLMAVVGILEYGAKKYAPHNWKKVENGEDRYKEALLRHTVNPEGVLGRDPESGLLHVAHIACNALFLLEMVLEKEERLNKF